MNTRTIPISFQGHERTLAQRTILRLLDRGEGQTIEPPDFVTVSGVYIGDVLALQNEGLITSEVVGEGQLEVRWKEQGA